MNLYRFFKRTFTITFIIEVICGVALLIYLIFFVILLNIAVLTTELEILFTLIALGGTCLILLVGIGFFMRIRNRFLKLLGTEEELPSATISQRIVLIIWIAAIIFFSSAVYYSLYLVYINFISPSIGAAFSILFILIFLGLMIICFVLQFFLVVMAKYTGKVLKQVLEEEE
ncbi:MAG: hypothetical protein ACFFAN_02360 [Promethearchaeota archaeon]